MSKDNIKSEDSNIETEQQFNAISELNLNKISVNIKYIKNMFKKN